MSKSNFLSYMINAFAIGLLIFGLLAIFGQFNQVSFMLFVIIFTIWALSMPLFSDFCKRKYLANYQNKYKDVSFIVHGVSLMPSPGTSLLADLDMIGIGAYHIKSMVLMTCNLQHGCEYYDQQLKKELQDIKIDMYGFGVCRKTNDNITLHSVSKILTEHENIITTKDNRIFVYYEPSHILTKKNKDTLKDGAYLFEVIRNEQVFKENIINKLNAMEKAA